jgi:hypothetical protein
MSDRENKPFSVQRPPQHIWKLQDEVREIEIYLEQKLKELRSNYGVHVLNISYDHGDGEVIINCGVNNPKDE